MGDFVQSLAFPSVLLSKQALRDAGRQSRLLLLDYSPSNNKNPTQSWFYPRWWAYFCFKLSYSKHGTFFALMQKFHQIDRREALLVLEVLGGSDLRGFILVYEE